MLAQKNIFKSLLSVIANILWKFLVTILSKKTGINAKNEITANAPIYASPSSAALVAGLYMMCIKLSYGLPNGNKTPDQDEIYSKKPQGYSVLSLT